VELAALFAGTVSKIFVQIFTGSTQKVRKFEIVIGQGISVEMVEQVNKLVVLYLSSVVYLELRGDSRQNF